MAKIIATLIALWLLTTGAGIGYVLQARGQGGGASAMPSMEAIKGALAQYGLTLLSIQRNGRDVWTVRVRYRGGAQ